MKNHMFATLLALPVFVASTAASAATPMYFACVSGRYDTPTRVTPLYQVDEKALNDGYDAYTYDKNAEWEKSVTDPDGVRHIRGVHPDSLMGQFERYAESHGYPNPSCFVTLTKDRAMAWYRKTVARKQTVMVEDFRPTKFRIYGVEDWSGNALASGTGTEPEQKAGSREEGSAHVAAKGAEAGANPALPAPPARPKKSNAQADAEYAAALEVYRQKLAEQQAAVAAFHRAEDEIARQKEASERATRQAQADYEARLAEHARAVAEQQLDYRKSLAKPANAPNAVYRGFTAGDCATARSSATSGAGTSSGTRFTEVEVFTINGSCNVRGWWWDTNSGGTSRQ